ncbi:serine-rich adhesin for platelets-like [Centruroides vittatus]|uniref:serine-rich adhesin for platelets-like n=1 Tax=Centruroides vittatus TaxID=120091 RepID=UPI00350E9A8D
MNENQQVEASSCENESVREKDSNSNDTLQVSIDDDDDSSSDWEPIVSPLKRCRRRQCRSKKKKNASYLNYELTNAYNIIQYLMSPTIKSANRPFMEERCLDGSKEVKRSMWLGKVKTLLLGGKYNTITEVVRDIRLIFENCYRSYKSSHMFFKRALKLEMLLEQKLALLTRKIKDKTTIELTSMPLIKESGVQMESKRSLNSSLNDTSRILFYVNKIKDKMEKENKKKHVPGRKVGRKRDYSEVIEWENKLIQEHSVNMKAMWELPQIGHFLFLAQKTLNIPELHMYALERVFLMPRESIYLATIITSLLSSPYQRTKLHRKPPMPYRIWHERLKLRVENWYKLYNAKHKNTRKVFDIVGIEPDFFNVLGDTNPFLKKDFHELTYHQRVWLVKALCDHCLNKHKTIQDAISENTWLDQKELILGVDRHDKCYIHFPQFCGLDVRIYRQSICKTFQTPDFILHARSQRKRSKENKKFSTENAKILKKNKKKEIHPDIEKFELIVDGVESLRNLIAEFSEVEDAKNKKGKNEQPQCEIHLYKTLCNLLEELEPWESKLQQVVKRARVRLKKEWDNYKLKATKGEEKETAETIWDNEPDEEQANAIICTENNEDSVDCNDSPDNDSSEEEINNTRTQRKRSFNTKDDNEEVDYSSEFELSVSSRGRIRKIRKMNTVTEERQIRTKKISNQKEKLCDPSNTTLDIDNMNDGVNKNLISKTVDQAKGQYEWETLRQIILSVNKVDQDQSQEQKGQSGSKLLSILNKSIHQKKEKTSCDTPKLENETKQVQDESALCSSVSNDDQILSSGSYGTDEAADFSIKLETKPVTSKYKSCSYATTSTSSINSNNIPLHLDTELKLSSSLSNIPSKLEGESIERIEEKQVYEEKKDSMSISSEMQNLKSNKETNSEPVKIQIKGNSKNIIEGKNSPHLQFYNLKLSSTVFKNNDTHERKSSIQSKSAPQLLSIVDHKGNKIYLQCIPVTQTTESSKSKGTEENNAMTTSNTTKPHILLKETAVSVDNSKNLSVPTAISVNSTQNNSNSILLNNVNDSHAYLKEGQNISLDNYLKDTQTKMVIPIIKNAKPVINDDHSTQLDSTAPSSSVTLSRNFSSTQPSAYQSIQIIGNASILSSKATESQKLECPQDASSLQLLHLSPTNSSGSSKKNETLVKTFQISQSPSIIIDSSTTNTSASSQPNNILSSNEITVLTSGNTSKLDSKIISSPTSTHQNFPFTVVQQPLKLSPSKSLQLSPIKTTNSVTCDKSLLINNVGNQINNSRSVKTVPNILVKQKHINPIQVFTVNSNSSNTQIKQYVESTVNGSSVNRIIMASPSVQNAEVMQYQLPVLETNSNQQGIQTNQIKLFGNQNINVKKPLVCIEEQNPTTVISPLIVGNGSVQNEKSSAEHKKNIPVDHIYT